MVLKGVMAFIYFRQPCRHRPALPALLTFLLQQCLFALYRDSEGVKKKLKNECSCWRGEDHAHPAQAVCRKTGMKDESESQKSQREGDGG